MDDLASAQPEVGSGSSGTWTWTAPLPDLHPHALLAARLAHAHIKHLAAEREPAHGAFAQGDDLVGGAVRADVEEPADLAGLGPAGAGQPSGSQFDQPVAVRQPLLDRRPINLDHRQQGRVGAVADPYPDQTRAAAIPEQIYEILVAADDDGIVAHRLGPDGGVCGTGQIKLADMEGLDTPIPKPCRQYRRQLLIDDQSHAARMTA